MHSNTSNTYYTNVGFPIMLEDPYDQLGNIFSHMPSIHNYVKIKDTPVNDEDLYNYINSIKTEDNKQAILSSININSDNIVDKEVLLADMKKIKANIESNECMLYSYIKKMMENYLILASTRKGVESIINDIEINNIISYKNFIKVLRTLVYYDNYLTFNSYLFYNRTDEFYRKIFTYIFKFVKDKNFTNNMKCVIIGDFLYAIISSNKYELILEFLNEKFIDSVKDLIEENINESENIGMIKYSLKTYTNLKLFKLCYELYTYLIDRIESLNMLDKINEGNK